MPKYIATETAFVAANARLRKKASGSIGSGVRFSHQRNATSRTRPATMRPITCGSPQPTVFVRTTPRTMPRSPKPLRRRPTRSSLSWGPVVSFRCLKASGIVTMPIGTFSQKIHCQLMPSTIAPPTTGPIATARPAMPPHAPRIAPRFSLGAASARIVSVSGVTIAAPTPWSARAATSISMPVESAARTEAAVKIDIPITNMRLRPKRSPSAAPVRRRTANVSVYAFTVHSRPEIDASSSSWITGRAVTTTRLSSAVMNSAIVVIPNVQASLF